LHSAGSATWLPIQGRRHRSGRSRIGLCDDLIVETFDVVVVGAGSSGATLAGRLSEMESRSVLVLEAGPEYRSVDTPPFIRRRLPVSVVRADSPYQWGAARVRLTAGQSEQPYPQGRGVGGTSAINALAAIRGTPLDYDGWAAGGCEGWSWRDVVPAFCALEDDPQFGDRDYHGAGGPIPIFRPPMDLWGSAPLALRESAEGLGFGWADDHNDPTSNGASTIAFNVRDNQRVSTNDAYLEPARDRPNLHLRGAAEVRRVVFDRGRAAGVELCNGEVIEAAEVVLCAGAIQTPAILMRSGIGPAERLRMLEIDVVVDLPAVGENLRDHPLGGLVLQLGPAAAGPGLYPLACYLRCETGSDDGPNNTIIGAMDLPGSPDRPRLASMWVKAAISHSRGRVSLRSPDPGVYPSVEFEMLSDGRDLARLREGSRLLGELLAHPAFGGLVERAYRVSGPGQSSGKMEPFDPRASDDDLDAWLRSACGTIWHPAGTCAMGPSGSVHAVVGPDCRVMGVDDLRIVDASIMPALPRANPNLTCIMLAEVAAARW